MNDPLTRDEIRPDKSLFTYYFLCSLLLGPFFFVALIPLTFRFKTLRYRFDEEGVSMLWGILFRKEISLTYARIQDIHLSSNLLERWLGLGKVQIQTASGNATAELTIEGQRNYEEIRDFLYSRMRGIRDEPGEVAAQPGSEEPRSLQAVLDGIATELRGIRTAIERRAE